MAAKIGLAGDLDRAGCRAAVEARFSTERMVNDHLALYRRLLGRSALAQHAAPGSIVAESARGGRLA